jgi:hypothetical protein
MESGAGAVGIRNGSAEAVSAPRCDEREALMVLRFVHRMLVPGGG